MGPAVRVCEVCGIPYVRLASLMRRRCREHDENAPGCTFESSTLQCGAPANRIMGCRGLKRLREKHGKQFERRVSGNHGRKVANFLLELIRHAPGRPPPPPAPPITRTTDATASALEQHPGRGPRWIKVRSSPECLSDADRAARMREVRDEEGQEEPAGRTAPIRRQKSSSKTPRS